MNLVILEDKFECTLLSLLKDFRKRGMSSWQPAGGLAVLLVRNTGPGQESERGKRPKQEEHTNLGPMPRSSTRLECDDQTPNHLSFATKDPQPFHFLLYQTSAAFGTYGSLTRRNPR